MLSCMQAIKLFRVCFYTEILIRMPLATRTQELTSRSDNVTHCSVYGRESMCVGEVGIVSWIQITIKSILQSVWMVKQLKHICTTLSSYISSFTKFNATYRLVYLSSLGDLPQFFKHPNFFKIAKCFLRTSLLNVPCPHIQIYIWIFLKNTCSHKYIKKTTNFIVLQGH